MSHTQGEKGCERRRLGMMNSVDSRKVGSCELKLSKYLMKACDGVWSRGRVALERLCGGGRFVGPGELRRLTDMKRRKT